ncbi:hypothetical protein HDU98_005903 [Podochytrium sp. JEL0797]|nr:hypothetical protein HDU98_005903 [Podochytrium sp. JEL0797]
MGGAKRKPDTPPDPNNAAEKHRIANRLAQRAFRERKDLRIRELQHQVAALEATVASLRNDNSLLKANLPTLNTTRTIPTCAPSTALLSATSTTFKPLSAAQLHGAPPTVASFGHELQLLPSLHNCTHVDLLLSLFVDQSLQRDSFSIRKRIFQIQQHKCRIYESCDEIDRVKAIEILCRMKALNKEHVDLMYNHWDDVRINPAELAPVEPHESRCIRKRDFVYAIRSIPCLQYASAPLLLDIEKLIVAEMKSTDCVEKVRIFFTIVDYKEKLYAFCENDEDRNQLTLAIEIGRYQNKAYWDKLFEQVESVMENPPLSGYD